MSNKPFYRSQCKAWFVKDDASGKMVRLTGRYSGTETDHKAIKSATEAEAEMEFCRRKVSGELAPVSASKEGVGKLVADFLNSMRGGNNRKAARTLKWYDHYLTHDETGMLAHVGGTTAVGKITPEAIGAWINSAYKTANARINAKRAASRLFNWAKLPNPVREAKAWHPAFPDDPTEAYYERRKSFVSVEQWEQIATIVPDGHWFKDVLTFLWLSGCRPQEVTALEARHFNGQHLVLERGEAKGKKRERIIPLGDVTREIIERLATANPTGRLFRSRDGAPINRNTLNNHFRRLSKKLGCNVCAYMFRHGFATRALTNKTADLHTVACVMGHTNTKMLETNYSHLLERADYLTTVMNSM